MRGFSAFLKTLRRALLFLLYIDVCRAADVAAEYNGNKRAPSGNKIPDMSLKKIIYRRLPTFHGQQSADAEDI